ncbi:fumarylacetoacetate hydrolase family protein [Rossellomorea vietnamensis]|uniref:Fumarylacetoacetate hydrolase family protein n=1 Tax=Rossellomorea vietnamensis TaxID=218284 RepID=A0A5D4NNA6_9BACI|nr:fumarylacetoacetate hydrolase family protein [Rossellomorea vietnamensis]TYS15021.1 fumarylacetoacetate hydrolase family protein [Rossellomorea vietnamensis]
MKFISYQNKDGKLRLGILQDKHTVVDVHEASEGALPDNILSFLENSEKNLKLLQELNPAGKGIYSMEEVLVKAPVPLPVSIRDFYAFEEHVKTARKNRGLDVVPEWYEMPVFYFSNHLAVKGDGEAIQRPANCSWLDYELEIACVIGKEGRNICRDNAEEYIFGYCIMNDWSARDLQREEMKVGLGPAKGKDFATSIGPYIVTKDELEPYRKGDRYDLKMTAKVNGQELSSGNFKSIYYTFAEMIERASADVTLYPGEVIGSGTVGTGCILELGTDVHRWLEPGDTVELEITALGKLSNEVKEGGF